MLKARQVTAVRQLSLVQVAQVAKVLANGCEETSELDERGEPERLLEASLSIVVLAHLESDALELAHELVHVVLAA